MVPSAWMAMEEKGAGRVSQVSWAAVPTTGNAGSDAKEDPGRKGSQVWHAEGR